MGLRKLLPWTKTPLIINAPMGGFAGAELSTAVSKAGGLGFIGATADMDELNTRLSKAEQLIDRRDGLLPIGVGILAFMSSIDKVIPILQQYKPAIVWFFAAMELEDYTTWAKRVRAALPQSQIWIQAGSVEAALKIAKDTKPDVMCIQGADAGGHGFEKGAGIISLLPEVADALAKNGHGHIPLVTAGGISDGRSAAAAFALGAEGVVMGTRFLSAPETHIHPVYQQALFAASDGGQSTTRSKLFDNLRGPNQWPGPYDGRSIVQESLREFQNDVDIEQIRKKHNEAVQADDGGFGKNGSGRAAMWAGTGVGFVNQRQPAAEIVEEIRNAVVKNINTAISKL